MEDIVTVAEFRQPEEAHLAGALLEAQGIDSYVAFNTVGNLYAFNTGSGNCQLKVFSADAESARAILVTTGSTGIDEEYEYEDESEAFTCPQCGSDDLEELPEESEPLPRKVFFTVLTLGLYLLAHETRLRCRRCGHTLTR
jgi:hypothetical protein